MAELIQTLLDNYLAVQPKDLLSEQIKLDAESSEQRKAFVVTALSEWKNSRRRKEMITGQKYYDNFGEIRKRQTTVIDQDGNLKVAPYLANNRIAHAFLRKLVKQKTGYILSKPFIVSVDEGKEEFVRELKKYFTPAFYNMLKHAGKDGIVNGISWIQPYYDDEGILKFKRLPSLEVIAFWKDSEHLYLDAGIRTYNVTEYVGGSKRKVQCIDYFTPEAVYHYQASSDNTLLTDETWDYNFTMTLTKQDLIEQYGTDSLGMMWQRIPLIAIKYNQEETPLIRFVKEIIDDYDKHTSLMSNVLEDEPNKIKIVRNYDGTDKAEFQYNLAKFRTAFVREDGEITTLDTHIDPDALNSHLNRLRKDLYELGGGVDTQNQDLAAASGTSLKFVYADLDMDATEFGGELVVALEQIIWFIKQDILLRTGVDYTDTTVRITLNTDIAINETETITNLVNSKDVLSKRTLVEMHPYVEDVEDEMKRLAEDQEEEMMTLADETEIAHAYDPPPTQASAS